MKNIKTGSNTSKNTNLNAKTTNKTTTNKITNNTQKNNTNNKTSNAKTETVNLSSTSKSTTTSSSSKITYQTSSSYNTTKTTYTNSNSYNTNKTYTTNNYTNNTTHSNYNKNNSTITHSNYNYTNNTTYKTKTYRTNTNNNTRITSIKTKVNYSSKTNMNTYNKTQTPATQRNTQLNIVSRPNTTKQNFKITSIQSNLNSTHKNNPYTSMTRSNRTNYNDSYYYNIITNNKNNYLLPDLNIPLEQLLKENNYSVEDLNELIRKAVEEAGYGSREGVVTAGQTLANYLTSQGTKLPYISRTGLAGMASGKYSDLGVNKDWGTPGKWHSGYGKDYYRSGLDCSGFISWALHNGGYEYNEYHSSQFENLGTKREFDSNGQAGDILWKDGHVALITDVNKNGYTILHETENDEIDKQVEGLIYTHTDFTGKDKETTKQFTHIIDMSEYYNNPANLEN